MSRAKSLPLEIYFKVEEDKCGSSDWIPARRTGEGRCAMIRFTVNGKKVEVDAVPSTPLLWVLREDLQLTGTKYGCGMALCGACTVHLEGQAVRSCVTPVSRA